MRFRVLGDAVGGGGGSRYQKILWASSVHKLLELFRSCFPDGLEPVCLVSAIC